MDIWSLGCVFLEFLTWYGLGKSGLDMLATSRNAPSGGTRVGRNAYFEIVLDDDTGQTRSCLNAGVSKFLDKFRADAQASPFINDFLNFIQYRALEPRPDARADASEVVAALKELARRAQDLVYHRPNVATFNRRPLEDDNDEYQDAFMHNLEADGILTADPNIMQLDTQTGISVDSGYCTMPPITSSDLIYSSANYEDAWQDTTFSYSSAYHDPAAQQKLPTVPHQSAISSEFASMEPNDGEGPQLFPCPFYHHDPKKFGTKDWYAC
ncbi:hypothetical protein C8035_v000900 [Colletotrichum spinosum]|uniref:Protein kinase domain-containing protein n=1 Tax=Colletotrichum spinosum TaxID=1347390 RepID=A0A4R8Q1T2_9PEZI|nr:hypothetical protein C8035_v000900 [Colletotrichum spinosum]